jgi:hypothetical protein
MSAPRYLAARSELGYVDSPARGLPGEPEAVSDEEQLSMTERAHQQAFNERVERRQATATEIERELEHLEARCRYLRRQLKRLRR